MSRRGIFAIFLVAVFVAVLLAPLPSDRQFLWTFASWSIFLGSLIVTIGVVANLTRVLILMYFGYDPGKRRSDRNLMPIASVRQKSTLIQEMNDPEDLLQELYRLEDALSNVKTTLAFHRFSPEQRHQYDRAFAELEVLIQQVSTPRNAERIAS